jgi:hypothetical protein
MKKIIAYLILIIGFSFTCVAQEPLKYLGELKPFWRNHPVLGPQLQTGLWIDKVPEYMLNTDFPYKKRPFDKEVLFADHLSVVRLMGGTFSYPGFKVADKTGVNEDGTMKISKFDAKDTVSIKFLSQYDFVFRKEDGSLGFRPELIAQRLFPYTNIGYTSFTIVLDCTPWALRKNPVIGSFGQVGPADHPEEWYATVRELCKTLKNILGQDNANKLRFRIGTEMNGKERFGGTEKEFITYFDYAASAITDILPDANLGLFNISAASINNIKSVHNVNAFHVLEHAATGRNSKTGMYNKASPFVAASRYYSEKTDLNDIVGGIDKVWDFVKDSVPGNTNFSREIHEFGAIGDWNAKIKTQNPDAFGNAMNLTVVMNLHANGLDRLFLWNMLDKVPGTSDADKFKVASSQLWGYSVLDYMAGGKAYQLIPEVKTKAINTIHTGLLSVFPKKAYVLVSAFNPDRLYSNSNTVVLKIPKKNLPFNLKSIKKATINRENSIYDNIVADTKKEGILNPLLENMPFYIPNFKDISNDSRKFMSMIKTNWNNYEENWKDAMKLKNFKGTIVEDKSNYIITIEMGTPESTVLVFE